MIFPISIIREKPQDAMPRHHNRRICDLNLFLCVFLPHYRNWQKDKSINELIPVIRFLFDLDA